MRPCASDGLPIMGAIPNFEGAYVSTGHNCWGILWAPISGLAMSELIVSGKSTVVNLAPFSPSRFLPRQQIGTRGRKKGNVDVGEQW